jgi:hypothetical protein
MAIHGFVFLKFTKPADEHLLQAFPNASANLVLFNQTISLPFINYSA